MKKFAFVFPGQGSQKVGMLDQLVAEFPMLLTLFSDASDVLGYDLWEIVTQGPEEKINQTIYTQPAMLLADIAVWKIWQQKKGGTPLFLAGHSLGEYSALVAAEVIRFTDAVNLVAKRAQFMQACVQPGEGAMAAMLGLSADAVTDLCHQASPEGNVMLANINCPGQIVVAGYTKAVETAVNLARARGAKAMKLAMSVPSHCSLMKPAAEKLAKELDQVAFNSPTIAVINNVDVDIVTKPELIKQALIRQLDSPVRWIETIEKMLSNGIEIIAECGPGKVLTNMNKRINPDVKLFTMNNQAEIENLYQEKN